MGDDRWTAAEAEKLRIAVGRFVRAGHRRDEIPGPQASALGYLDRSGGLSIAELAALERVRHQSMRQTVSALHKAGAITLTSDAHDGRKVVCHITEQGRAALDRDRETRARWILDAASERLTASQRRKALEIAEILELLADDADPPQRQAGPR